MEKDELIAQDLANQISEVEIKETYLRLYPDYEDVYKRIFAYFHQSFNGLFEFLNYKSSSNGHYNAHESRELIDLIDKFEEFTFVFKSVGKEVILNKTYMNAIETCKGFLVPTNGSSIPKGFEAIILKKYEPIIEMPNKAIYIPQTGKVHSLSMVGQGAFSIVQKYHDPFYNRTFAVKQAKKNLDTRELSRFKREFEILQSLKFPYVLEVYGYDEQKISYIMEYCNSTLHDYITKNNQKLSFANRKKLALQFLYGVNYLHAKKLLHRDISYNNILVKQFDYGAALIKLSDFGLVKEDESVFTKTDTEMKGTIIDPSLESFKHYEIRHEIYAIGFVLLFIFTGKRNLKTGDQGIFRIVDKCTDKTIETRYGGVSEIITDVDKLQSNDR